MTSWKLADVREPIERLVIRGGRELTVTIRREMAMPSARASSVMVPEVVPVWNELLVALPANTA